MLPRSFIRGVKKRLPNTRKKNPAKSADDAAATVSEHESYCLKDCHKSHNNACGAARGSIYPADKIGIRHVVYGRNEHTDHGRNAELYDKARYRLFCHHLIARLIFTHINTGKIVPRKHKRKTCKRFISNRFVFHSLKSRFLISFQFLFSSYGLRLQQLHLLLQGGLQRHRQRPQERSS